MTLYVILGLISANVGISDQLLKLAVAETLEDPIDAHAVIYNRFWFAGQFLLVAPVLCGFLTDWLGRYSHLVVVACCLALTVLQGLLLAPWTSYFPEEDCRIPEDPASLSFCGAQQVLLAVFLIHTVIVTQTVNQTLKMLATRASKVFPVDPQHRQIEIQRTGTMSIVLSAGIQAALAAVSPALHDSKHIGWVLGLLGCGSTLVTAVLSLAYTSQSFHIARSKRELLPVAAVTARFTDDADSVIASEPDDTSRGLLGGVETGGYGSLSQAFSLDDDGFGADEGAAGYQPQALTPGVDGFPVDGDDSGAEAETLTPVISLPFLTFLLASLALTLAESPLPWLENQRFHPDDDVLEAISPAAATTGTSSGNGQLPPNAADLRLTAYLEAGFAALLVQAVVYMAASVAYAALLAEMPSFRVFRTAFPFLCGLALAAGIVFYDANRSETTSTVIVDAIQVLCFITVQYLRWFLLAAVPESLYGLLTIAIGVGVTVIGAAESRIIPWNELVTVVTMQAALLLAAGTSVLVSVWARDWLTGAVPTAHPHGATPLMQTAGLVGYGAAAPTRRPEAVVGGGPDELFGRDPPTEPTPASSATSLSGYHFSAAE